MRRCERCNEPSSEVIIRKEYGLCWDCYEITFGCNIAILIIITGVLGTLASWLGELFRSI